MPEIIQESVSEVGTVAQGFEAKRVEALKNEGLGSWLAQFEIQIQAGLIPAVVLEEGRLCAARFGELKELQLSQPLGTTEGLIMDAIVDDLKLVFGNAIETKIDALVVENLMPLRGIETTSDAQPNRFLKMAAMNVIRDLAAVARMFQLNDEELRTLYPELDPQKMRQASLTNLGFSLMFRSLKGEARKEGYCSKTMHTEHIWSIRGLRDLPFGGLRAIGEFLDRQILSS